MSADNSVHDHLTNEEYNMASEVWYHAELVLKQCVVPVTAQEPWMPWIR